MRAPRLRLLLALLAAFSLILAACSSDDDGDSADTTSDADAGDADDGAGGATFEFTPLDVGGPLTKDALTAGDIDKLVERLGRIDRLSPRGPWTKQVLALVAKHPQRRAGDLAPILDRELRAFKADVRKLKAMGLTTSFEVGYELTPLGRRILKAL